MMNGDTRGFAAVLGLVIVTGAIGCRAPEPGDASQASREPYPAPAVSVPDPSPPLPAMASELSPESSAPTDDVPPDDGLGEYPEWNGRDLDCDDVGHPVRVTGPDPHRLDRDHDGVGCESQ